MKKYNFHWKCTIKLAGCFGLLLSLLLPIALAQALDLPKNAHKNIYGSGWVCKKGFYRSGNKCEPVKIPKHGKLNYLGNGWECQRGFKRSGNKCEPVKIPKHGKLNYLGNGWECQRGYKRSGNKCLLLKIPKHGKLTYLGNDWECQKSFKRIVNECVPMTQKELAQQRKIQQEIAKKIQQRRLKRVSGDHCETEYRTNAEVCVKVMDASLDCNKSMLGEYYNDCDVSLDYIIETDYRGGSYLDVNVSCNVDIEYKGRKTYISQTDSSSEEESHSIYAYGSDSNTLDFNYGFSSFDEVLNVKVTSYSCEIQSVDLW